MAEATDETVRGRFDGTEITYAGITSSFFRRDGRFYVRTDGPDGRLADFEIAYTFGVTPLQQYLVAFPGGRLQALSLAWDDRAAASGGQRWFHLYSAERITADDPLHWTGALQNWNYMCADCHSTNLRKGYDAATRTYATTWSEISVGCEACHGPGEAHVAWARRGGAATGEPAARYLRARLDERQGVSWSSDPVTARPVRSAPRTSDREIEVCARCHARRSQLTDAFTAGDRFEDGFRATLLEPGLFHADGQQLDEVYTYASFLQSRMHARGVTCSDCHDPHSARVKLPGNAVCTQCHVSPTYDTPGHHRHTTGGAAAACVTCHMPSTTYMVVDPRRDHSFRVPRPDLADRLDVPDACTTACHAGRTPAWASAQIQQWTGRSLDGMPHFGEVFHAAAAGPPASVRALHHLAADEDLPAIVRASALERIAAGGGHLESAAASRLLRDVSPLVRRAALGVLPGRDPAARLRLITPLLSDPVRSVRAQAALAVLDVSVARLPEQALAAFDRSVRDHVSEQLYNADRPEAQTNLGTTYMRLGRLDLAVPAFREAITLDRTYVPAYVNLADVHRSQQREAEAERVLREAIAAVPGSGDAHHALGLSLVRQRRIPEALAALGEASRLAPQQPRFAYVYAVALHDTGRPEQALDVLHASVARHPSDRDTLSLLGSYALAAGRQDEARTHAERLMAIDPTSPEARALVEQLRARPPEGGAGRRRH
jgi:tetratricopeptide (TPR) repeat protein